MGLGATQYDFCLGARCFSARIRKTPNPGALTDHRSRVLEGDAHLGQARFIITPHAAGRESEGAEKLSSEGMYEVPSMAPTRAREHSCKQPSDKGSLVYKLARAGHLPLLSTWLRFDDSGACLLSNSKGCRRHVIRRGRTETLTSCFPLVEASDWR